MSAHIVTITNQKGGVGKSTTAAAIASGLNLRGIKTLIIDFDAQGNLTNSYKADKTVPTIADVLTGDATAAEAIQTTEQGDLIASAPGLGSRKIIDAEEIGAPHKLRKALEGIRDSYDYIIVDTPPALSILTINALTASTGAIIATHADAYSLQGIGQLYKTIEPVREFSNPALEIWGIVITRYTARSKISQANARKIEEAARAIGTKVYRAMIRECSALRETQTVKQSIFAYAPKSNASADYTALIDEILQDREA